VELRAAGHLPAYAADVAQRPIQIIHARLTLYCKVNPRAVNVK
jgi:hypothetical protein